MMLCRTVEKAVGIACVTLYLVQSCGVMVGCTNSNSQEVEARDRTPSNTIRLLSEKTTDQSGVHVLVENNYLSSTTLHAPKGEDFTLRIVIGFNIDSPFFCRIDDRIPMVSVRTPWIIESNGKEVARYNRQRVGHPSSYTFQYVPKGASASRRAVQENHGIVVPVEIPLALIPKSLDQVSVPIQIQIAIFDTASCTMHHLNEVQQLRIKLD